MADPQLDPQFEQMGVETVRARLLEFSTAVRNSAILWLATEDQRERLRDEASQASQTRLARSANRAAWIAAIAAIIAATAATMTIVLELAKK